MNNPKSLGVNNGQLSPMPQSPNAVSSQTDDAGKQVDALPMTGSGLQTKQKIISCLTEMRGNVINNETGNYLHSVFTSRLMRFKDDVEFYIDESAKLVHFRSASRVGHSDLGANRKRYQAFKELYLK
jgi:uncharacterized protein (DUF1499 family)